MSLSRRLFLQSAGASLVLPQLHASKISNSSDVPLRAVFIALGYGPTAEYWYPKITENSKEYTLTPALKPLAENKKNFSVIQNLTITKKIGPHDSSAEFLSNGSAQSCDQVIADSLCVNTRYNSLSVLPDRKVSGGHGRISSLSRDIRGNYLPGISGVVDLYYTLFGSQSRSIPELRNKLKKDKSLLDGLRVQMKSFNKKLGKDDKQILEQYYTSVRSIEQKITRAEKWLDVPLPKPYRKLPKVDSLSATENVKLIYDLMTFAMQTDQTRVFTFLHPVATLLQEAGLTISGHNMSHYGQDPIRKPASLKRDVMTTELFNYFINKLKSVQESDGSTLLDNSMIVMGTPMHTGHNTRNGALLLAGQGKGKVKQGQNIGYKENETSMANLWYSMIKQVKPHAESFTDGKQYMTELFKS
ncbi:MAG: DUF1552 domain-containing protein [Lentisphaeraceae bacterium]|nr:DUF1552 domain-containing protein [Lentisphaeraceae bacterium]